MLLASSYQAVYTSWYLEVAFWEGKWRSSEKRSRTYLARARGTERSCVPVDVVFVTLSNQQINCAPCRCLHGSSCTNMNGVIRLFEVLTRRLVQEGATR